MQIIMIIMRMKKILVLLPVLFALFAITPAMGAIEYGDKTYTAPFAASTTESVGGLVKDFSIKDINSAESITAGFGILSGISDFFTNINNWLKDTAGIDLFAILSAIGHWFVIILEWIIKGLKLLLRMG